MFKINPDPHFKGYQFSPLHRVRGLFSSCDHIERTVRALQNAGISEDVIEIFVGEEGVRKLDSKASHHGPVIRLLRDLESIFIADDTEIFANVDRILEKGGCTVDVLTRGDSEVRVAAAQALKSSDAKEVFYWGHLHVEKM